MCCSPTGKRRPPLPCVACLCFCPWSWLVPLAMSTQVHRSLSNHVPSPRRRPCTARADAAAAANALVCLAPVQLSSSAVSCSHCAVCWYVHTATTNVDQTLQVKGQRGTCLASYLVRPPAMVTKKWPTLVTVIAHQCQHPLQHLLLLRCSLTGTGSDLTCQADSGMCACWHHLYGCNCHYKKTAQWCHAMRSVCTVQ